MDSREELRTAWALWHILTDVTQTIWERYEDEFMRLCIELDRTDPRRFGRCEDGDEQH